MNSMKDSGFKLVFVMRLSPVLPFNLLNYLLSVTAVKLPHYVLASFIGMAPGTVFYVYIGATAASLANLSNRSPSVAEIVVTVVGGVFTLILLIFLVRYARRVINEAIETSKTSDSDVEELDAPCVRDVSTLPSPHSPLL